MISRLFLMFLMAFMAITVSPPEAQAGRRGLRPMLVDQRFYGSTNVNIYVTTAGSNETGDGKTVDTAYAGVGRALRDVPPGYLSPVTVVVGPGTYTADDQWIVSSISGRGNSPTPAGGTIRIIGDCTTPDAVISTTGAGTAVVTSAGGGMTGGVTRTSQFTFAPTLTSGAIAGVTDGSHYLTNTPAEGVTPTVTVVRASTSPNLVLVTSVGTALTTRRLCPFASIFSGAVTIDGGPVVASASAALSFVVSSLSLTNVSARNVTFNGARVTGSSPLVLQSVNSSNSFFAVASQFVSWGSYRGSISNSMFNLGLGLKGNFDSVSTNVARNTSGDCIFLSGSTATYSQPGNVSTVASFLRNDLEGTCTGIQAYGGTIAVVSTGATTVDITGKFLNLHHGARWINISGVVPTGKVTVASDVMSGSMVAYNGTWAITNVSSAAQQFNVGGAGFKDIADLPFIDITAGTGQLSRVSAGAD